MPYCCIVKLFKSGFNNHRLHCPLECGESREDFESCSTTSGYLSTATDMSTSVAVDGGRESKKDEGEEQKGVIVIEEDEFTPPDGGIRVCTNYLRIGFVTLIFFSQQVMYQL